MNNDCIVEDPLSGTGPTSPTDPQSGEWINLTKRTGSFLVSADAIAFQRRRSVSLSA